MKKNIIVNLSRFYKLRKKLRKIEPFKKGSLNERWHTCGTPNCNCKKEPPKKHGPYNWLTWKKGGKTKSMLVPVLVLKEVKEMIENSKLFKKIIKELEEVSELIIKQKIDHIRIKKKENQ